MHTKRNNILRRGVSSLLLLLATIYLSGIFVFADLLYEPIRPSSDSGNFLYVGVGVLAAIILVIILTRVFMKIHTGSKMNGKTQEKK